MYGYIYKFTLKPTNKFYVGKHKYENQTTLDENYWGSGKKWLRELNNYDKNDWITLIDREILQWCNSEDELNESEIYWIDKLDARNNEVAYNISIGGQNPVLYGEDNGFYNHQHIDETKATISAKSSKWQQENPGVSYSKLKKWQEENPDAYSKAQSRPGEKNGMWKYEWSNEQREHQSNMRINYAMHNDSKLKGRTKEDYPYLQEMSDRYKGHSLCDEGKEKISNFVSGSITVTNGKCNLRCKSDNVEYYENLGLGYHRGSTSGLICKCLPNFTTITNGYVNHRVPNDELEVWKSFGWVEGTKKSKVALIKLGLL